MGIINDDAYKKSGIWRSWGYLIVVLVEQSQRERSGVDPERNWGHVLYSAKRIAFLDSS